MRGRIRIAFAACAALAAIGLSRPAASAACGATQGQEVPKPASASEAKADTLQAPATGKATLGEVLHRISRVVAEHSAKAQASAAQAAPKKPRPAAARPSARSASPRGVTLTWDEQIDPRRTHPGRLGVRLVWPE